MRVGPKGQVTIPAEIRARFGFLPGTEVEFVVDDDTVQLVHATEADRTAGDRVVRHLRGRAASRFSTDEILALTREP
jgi:AbrB family looped-hinge helix DNA binding protein